MVMLTKEEAGLYLENRRQNKFNVIEAYFAHADWVINKAAEKGIVVILTSAYLGYGCGEEGWCAEVIANGTTKCKNYGRYLGNRYKNFKNIIWMEGGDTAATGSALAGLRAITEGIMEVDNVTLQTAHSQRQYSALDSYNESWLSINTTYSDCSSSASKTYTDYSRTRLMPFFFVEGTYENEGASQACIHSQAYWSILGGSTGHFFGNNPLWGLKTGWQAAMDSAGSLSMKHMGNLFNSRAWSSLVPDYNHTVVTAGYGTFSSTSYLSAARTVNGNTIIAYIPTLRTISVDMTKVSGSQAKAWWFHPSSGVATLIGTYANTGSREFTPEANGDWVLVLDDAGMNFPTPGSVGINNKVPSPPKNLKVQ